MNKNIFTVFAFFTGLLLVGYASASPRSEETYSTLEVTASSGIIFNGSGWIKGVHLSSPTVGSTFGNDWLVLLDTYPVNGNTYSRFVSANKKSVPLIYTSTPTTITTNPQPSTNVYWFQEPGIFISSTAYYFKTSASSGEAFKAIIYYKK